MDMQEYQTGSNSTHTVSHPSPKYPGGFLLQSTPVISGVYLTTCWFCWKWHKSLSAPMIISSLKALTVSPDLNYIVSFFFPCEEPLQNIYYTSILLQYTLNKWLLCKNRLLTQINLTFSYRFSTFIAVCATKLW